MSLDTLSIELVRWLWQTTWQAALLAGVIGCITWTLRRWISPGARQALWMLVFVRLMMPFLPASRFSIWSLYAHPDTKTTRIEIQNVHYSNAPLPAVEPTEDHDFVVPPKPSIFENPLIWLAIAWAAGAMLIFGGTVFSTFRFAVAIRRTAREPDESTANLIGECLQYFPLPVLWEGARVRVLWRSKTVPESRRRTLTPALSRSTGRGGMRSTHSALRVIVTDIVATPALFGVFRPALLLPPAVISTLDRESLRNVILHELEHLKRHHLAMDWLLTAIRAVHWFNPAAWWAHRQVRAAREFICDQAVIASLSDVDASQNYGNTLLAIAGHSLRASDRSVVAAFARDRRLLKDRIETIARRGKYKYVSGAGFVLATVLGVAFLTSPTMNEPVAAQMQPTTTPSDFTSLTTQSADNDDVAYKIAVLLKAARVAIDNGQYRDASDLLDKIAKLDPNNDHGKDVRLLRDRILILQQTDFRQHFDNKPPNDVDIRTQLDRELPEVRLENVAFSDVIDFLHDTSGTPIFVNWRALEAAGVDRNALITARLKEVKFSKVLDTILQDVGGGNVKLAYKVGEGVITITTEDDLNSNVSTRVYDIRDLANSGAADPAQRQESIDRFVKLIEDTIAPDSWKDRRGKYASIRELPGTAQLIVTQTPENHQKLHALLDQLREALAVQIHLDVKILEVPTKTAAEIDQRIKADEIFIDDVQVKNITGANGARTLGQSALTAFNGQEVVFVIGGEKESISLQLQSTVSQDRKYVTVNPWMTYSPNARISAEEQQQLNALGIAYASAGVDAIRARTAFGGFDPTVQKAELKRGILKAQYDDALRSSEERLKSTADQPAERWQLAERPAKVPDGGTVLLRHFKHTISRTPANGQPEMIDAPPGETTLWLLIRPTMIIQREKEQQQFPLLQH